MGKKRGARQDELTFEKALARLEEIVNELEGGEKGLDESIALFEEGTTLSRFCQESLDSAQGKIEKLVETASGRLSKEDLDAC